MKKAVIIYLFQEKITTFLYLIHLELVICLKIFMTYIKNLILFKHIWNSTYKFKFMWIILCIILFI